MEGVSGVTLGGVKYSEFEVERGQPILDLVYEPAVGSSTIGAPSPGERRSRRAGPVCKIGGYA